jgi:hypothetical protein
VRNWEQSATQQAHKILTSQPAQFLYSVASEFVAPGGDSRCTRPAGSLQSTSKGERNNA